MKCLGRMDHSRWKANPHCHIWVSSLNLVFPLFCIILYHIWRHRSKTCPTTWRPRVCACMCHRNQSGNATCCVLLWCTHLDARTVCPTRWRLSQQQWGYVLSTSYSRASLQTNPFSYRQLMKFPEWWGNNIMFSQERLLNSPKQKQQQYNTLQNMQLSVVTHYNVQYNDIQIVLHIPSDN